MVRRDSVLRLLFLTLLLFATASCKSDGSDDSSPTRMHSVSTETAGASPSKNLSDAGLVADRADRTTQNGDNSGSQPATGKTTEPASPTKPGADDGAWLDPTPRNTPWKTRRRSKSAPARVVRLTLRSTPPGAVAMVDGRRIGRTPTFWEGRVADEPHDFVFMLPGHAVARYRFVPVTDGHLHPRLDIIVTDDKTDAGPHQ